MIDGSEKRNRQLAFELQNSHVCEKRSKHGIPLNIALCLESMTVLDSGVPRSGFRIAGTGFRILCQC